MKSALAIHDLSCHGASSLSVAMPILLASSIDLSILPSTLLSSQSDGFEGLYCRDLGGECRRIMDVWRGYGLHFDSLYSGYLGDRGHQDLVMAARRDFLKADALILTDPVLGDGGDLYQNLTSGHVDMMRELVKGSDVITPNWTEAEIITELGYGKGKASQRMILDEIKVLRSLGPAKGVITGIPLEAGGLGNAAWDGDEVRLFQYEDEGVSYPGSGDLFASLLFGLVMKGDSFFSAALNATNTATYAVHMTKKNGRERRLGIMLKPVMDEIRRRML